MRGAEPLGEAASTTDATSEAVVAGGEFCLLPLPRRAAAFAAMAWSNSLVPPWMTLAYERVGGGTAGWGGGVTGDCRRGGTRPVRPA